MTDLIDPHRRDKRIEAPEDATQPESAALPPNLTVEESRAAPRGWDGLRPLLLRLHFSTSACSSDPSS